MITINPEKVCFVIAMAREFDVKVDSEELNDGNEGMADIMENSDNDPALEELVQFLGALDDDELAELLALTWIGRGDYGPDDWAEVMREIKDVRESHTIDYLIGTPLLADYLQEGLASFGLSCEE